MRQKTEEELKDEAAGILRALAQKLIDHINRVDAPPRFTTVEQAIGYYGLTPAPEPEVPSHKTDKIEKEEPEKKEKDWPRTLGR